MEALALLDAVLGRCPGMVSAIEGDHNRFLAAFAVAARALRGCTATPTAAEYEGLRRAGLAAPETLALAELARARLLLHRLARLPDDAHAGLVAELVQTGDNAERQAVLKTLMLLPEPARFLDTAIDAVRAVVLDTVAAIACDNAYPFIHFPPEAYRAMVLKAVHMGLPLARIHGLDRRRDGELARMGHAHASEQRAAGRPVSSDLALITGDPP